MYPVLGYLPSSSCYQPFYHQQSVDNAFRASNNYYFNNMMNPPHYQHQQLHPSYPYQAAQPVRQTRSTIVIVINQLARSSTPFVMQLPQSSNHSSSMDTSMPLNYNGYFSPAQSRPIQINAPNNSGRFAERVMGLDFEPQPLPNNNLRNAFVIESDYCMNFMDDENAPPSSSNASHSHALRTDSIENALRRSSEIEEASPPSSPSPRKAGGASSGISNGSTQRTISGSSGIRIQRLHRNEPEMRAEKRRSSYYDDLMINEETESEAGFSGDDDCISNCGCVHSCIGSPINYIQQQQQPLTSDKAPYDTPFTRMGFRSIGDIIGYAQVVRAERLEALAELRSAVDKFNDMRQRNENLRSKCNPTN